MEFTHLLTIVKLDEENKIWLTHSFSATHLLDKASTSAVAHYSDKLCQSHHEHRRKFFLRTSVVPARKMNPTLKLIGSQLKSNLHLQFPGANSTSEHWFPQLSYQHY